MPDRKAGANPPGKRDCGLKAKTAVAKKAAAAPRPASVQPARFLSLLHKCSKARKSRIFPGLALRLACV
ncbi:hypothetical protein A6M21_04525 [Desulfotomaculum copahuensis]|uniref:Uncharacterized protein n=1 Tax=Desulfotomaculum copahuensis TaxID=1838280 RepID=A0A1B7LHI9_9FIRM|nr:hypothetical protein A6M21_04525 [Desulfotomaculum copahuensis]